MIGAESGGYVEVVESSPNCDVAKASFDTYNERDWAGYQALQHPSVQWYEVEGRFFRGVDGVTEEVDNWRDAYPEASADVTNLFDCGGDRVIIEWTLHGGRRGLATGPEGQDIPENIRMYSADLMQLRDGHVYAGRTYYGLKSAQTVHAVQGGRQESPVALPDAPQYEARIDETPNALVARASFDTYNARDWDGYRALQHPDVEAHELEGRVFAGVDGDEARIDETPNALVARASFDTYNARDWDGYRALQHPDVEAHELEGRVFAGVDGVIDEIDGFRAAYPDAGAEISNLIDGGHDRVIIEWTLTGGPGNVYACDLMQLREGKIFRVRTYYGLVSALGVIGVQGLDQGG